MKQRLGLAQALLGNPDLLLLDEPTNGLDPAGIHEIRSLIRGLPQRCGATIFLSSHILAEVEQVATHFAIISEGQLRFQGTAEELRRRNKPVIVAAVDDVRRAAALLSDAGMSVRVDQKKVLVTCDDTYGPADVNTILVRGSIAVSELVSQHLTLEDAFLELTRSAEQQEHAVAK
jgi:ABC-2 type transport system ATP-binding protein